MLSGLVTVSKSAGKNTPPPFLLAHLMRVSKYVSWNSALFLLVHLVTVSISAGRNIPTLFLLVDLVSVSKSAGRNSPHHFCWQIWWHSVNLLPETLPHFCWQIWWVSAHLPTWESSGVKGSVGNSTIVAFVTPYAQHIHVQFIAVNKVRITYLSE